MRNTCSYRDCLGTSSRGKFFDMIADLDCANHQGDVTSVNKHTNTMPSVVTFVRKYVHIFKTHSWETFLVSFNKNKNSVPIGLFEQRN